ncbi:MAG: luciferase family protein [Anaerolineae bacterium]
MKYYSEEVSGELRERFEGEVLDWPEVTKRLMFGCPSYQAAGHLFAFLVDRGVVLTQLRQAERETLQERYALSEFEVGERTLHHWIQIPVKSERDLGYVMHFVRRSYERALSQTAVP